ncbi:CHASE2 domain-containing protein [Paucibacter sp. APW11]|uniref:histidine kinase n=1 Tax=Roseateles aquae TaxID=3077235 RepID=A0ABU3PDW5_9BURK|nr:CHASE2 domain-containing protein [Paucibacter sp. APW11]MDT9000738.1 CHASE2 domain-containing protein [Paucibacter sp. APW11]
MSTPAALEPRQGPWQALRQCLRAARPGLGALPLLGLPITLLLIVLLQLAGLAPRLADALNDPLQRLLAPPLEAPELVLVDIDDASLRALQPQLGDWPYPRQSYALLIDFLREAGARQLVLDIVLAGQRDGDAQLARALQHGLPSTLAAAALSPAAESAQAAPLQTDPAEPLWLQQRGRPGQLGVSWAGLTAPSPALLTGAGPGASTPALGLVSVTLDGDGVLRQLPLLHQIKGQVLPSLALAALTQAEGLQDWQLQDGWLQLGAHRWPVDAQGRARLALPGELRPAAWLSWERLMHAALGVREDPELQALLRERRVVLGSSAFFADQVLSPQGSLSGARLMATAQALLARDALLRPWHGAVQIGLLLLAWLPAWASLGSERPQMRRYAWLTALLLPALLAAVAYLLLVHRQIGTEAGGLLTPLLALSAGGLLGGLAEKRWQRRTHQRLLRERELAEATSLAKTQLLAQVSHEIRTPMNAVLGMAEILARSPLQPEQSRQLGVLSRGARQVFELINDLLDSSKLEAGKLQLSPHDFDLRELLELQIELLRARADEAGLALRLFCEIEGSSWVHGDAKRVAQIAVNLLGNAIKFTRQGSVSLRIWRLDGERIGLSCSDTGIGIAPELHEQIFRPYEQAGAGTSREFGGTGLGLSITRSLVELMGGTISLQSSPGQGSCFSLSLALPSVPPPQGERPRASATAPSRSLQLLLCEDNEVNVMLIEAMLTPLGHRITLAGDGQQALQRLAEQRFDLVLMDMQMPVLDGLAATRAWRRTEIGSGRRTPIVALSANAFDSDVQQCLAAGCDAHLSKPISLPVLLQALARWTES